MSDNLEGTQECLHQVAVAEQSPVLGSVPYLDGCLLPADWTASGGGVAGGGGGGSSLLSATGESIIRRPDAGVNAALSQPSLILNQAMVACQSGQLMVGKDVLQRLLATHQGFGPAIRALIGIYYRLGKRDEAMSMLSAYTAMNE